MGILSGIGTAIGGFFGGPTGASIGGSIGGFLGDAADVVQPFVNNVAPYASAYAVKESVDATNASNQKIAENANIFSAAQAEQNREFQAKQIEGQQAFNMYESYRNRQFQQESADKQMAFQERMSNSSYQRAVKDMEAAGLNPMLAYAHGGATSPSGGSASGSQASSGAASGAQGQAHTAVMSPAVAQAVNTGMAAAKLRGDLTEQQARTKLIEADAEKTKQDTATSASSAASNWENVRKLRNETLNLLAEYDNKRQQLHNLQSENDKTRFTVDQMMPIEKRILEIEEKLRGYEVPGMANRASAAGTWWGKNVAPYIKDFTAGAVGAGSLGLRLPK